MKQLEVQIMGQSYLLSCPEGGEQRLLEAVERVDTAMCRIRDGGKMRARDRIAVLAALNLAFDLGDGAVASAVTGHGALEANASQGPADNAEHHAADEAMLGTLIDRLDRALGEDGQLL